MISEYARQHLPAKAVHMVEAFISDLVPTQDVSPAECECLKYRLLHGVEESVEGRVNETVSTSELAKRLELEAERLSASATRRDRLLERVLYDLSNSLRAIAGRSLRGGRRQRRRSSS